MRIFYSLLFYLAIPFIILRLFWRSLKAPNYRKRWLERFGYYHQPITQKVVWFHAVSVGEAEAVFPLIKLLINRHPRVPVLVTTTTPTGSARVQAVLGNSVQHVYLPYDTPDIVSRFMSAFKPVLAVIMETEIWPNLFFYCGENNIPLYLINARLSERSAKGYRTLPSLLHPVLANVKKIVSQTEEDAARFKTIGAKPEHVLVGGNIKFDLEISEQLIKEGKLINTTSFKDRYVWLVASTHKGEEQIFFDVYKQLKAKIPELLLLVVPRHPERFSEVEALGNQNNLSVIKRSSKLACRQDTDIYLADTMGELKMLYAAANITFVGGSMVPIGGHNLLEPAAVGTPILFGPFMDNFKEIAHKVLTYQAAIQCQDNEAIANAVLSVYSDADYRNLLIDKGKIFVQENRGAIKKVCEILSGELPQPIN